MPLVPREDDFDSSDSDDNTLMLVIFLTLSIEASGLRCKVSDIPRLMVHMDYFARENLIRHHYFGSNPVYPTHVFR